MILARACRSQRATLEALVLHGERSDRTPAALDHLEACPTCERDLTALALTVAALRRAGRELRAAPVPSPTHAGIAALRARRRATWSWRLQLGGLLTGAAIAAVVVLPTTRSTSWGAGDAAEPVPLTRAASWRLAEARIAAGPDTPSFAAPGIEPTTDPQGLTRPGKEVARADATPRELRPR